MQAILTELQAAPPRGGEALHFTASIRPNVAMSEHGLTIVLVALGGLSLMAGLVFLSMGAWPVAGFLGLDILLVWWALSHVRKRLGGELETIEISSTAIHVCKRDHRGRERHWGVSPAFARLELVEHQGRAPELFLRSGTVGLPIGLALSPAEKAPLAAALTRAIETARRHRYEGETP